MIIGNRELWRIDPTGQFFDCHAVVIGNGSERVETELYEKLKKRMSSGDEYFDFENVFEELRLSEALELALECMKLSIQETPNDRIAIPMIPTVYWQGLVIDYSAVLITDKAPRRKFLKGQFLPQAKSAN